MRTIFATCLFVQLFSCVDKDRETDQLNQRITRLEHQVDSLINGRNVNSMGLGNTNSSDTTSYRTFPVNGHCHAITKKGAQCKRKAKSNGYCWQHGG